MKNLLALVGLVVVGVGGLGWYLGWYQIGTAPAPSGQRHFNVDVNTAKITQDLQKGEKKIEALIHPDDKGSNVTPPTPTPEKKEGQPVGLHFTPDGATFILPPLTIKQ